MCVFWIFTHTFIYIYIHFCFCCFTYIHTYIHTNKQTYIHTYVCIDTTINLANCPQEVGFNQVELQELRDLFLDVPRRFKFQGDDWSHVNIIDIFSVSVYIYLSIYLSTYLPIYYIFPHDMWSHDSARMPIYIYKWLTHVSALYVIS